MLGRSKRPEKAAAVVLAAGRSTRMGADNKLLLQLEPGVPVVCRAVEVGLSAGLGPVYVVTGHQAGEVRTALNGLDCRFVHNPDYAGGLSGSTGRRDPHPQGCNQRDLDSHHGRATPMRR